MHNFPSTLNCSHDVQSGASEVIVLSAVCVLEVPSGLLVLPPQLSVVSLSLI